MGGLLGAKGYVAPPLKLLGGGGVLCTLCSILCLPFRLQYVVSSLHVMQYLMSISQVIQYSVSILQVMQFPDTI